MKLAPIVLFVYNRLEHAMLTIEALKMNTLANKSNLYIYSDAHKTGEDKKKVDEVRTYIRSVDGFHSITIIEQNNNIGLANSVINGVTEVVKKHEMVIVLEDDLVTSKHFLSYMNDALQKYKSDTEVWHINAHMFPIDNTEIASTFFTKAEFCWGWATWSDRWTYFEKNPQDLIQQFNSEMKKEFNLNNSFNFFKQVELNAQGKIDTWAVFWYATIFLNKGLCLNVRDSLVQNIGFDGSGDNCEVSDDFNTSISDNIKYEFPEQILESAKAKERLIEYFNGIKPSLIKNIGKRIHQIFKN